MHREILCKGDNNMKNKDKICDAFDALNKELDAKLTNDSGASANLDQESIDIDVIENSIMDKIEKMIDNKLGSLAIDNKTNEDELITNEAQDNENKGDDTNEN